MTTEKKTLINMNITSLFIDFQEHVQQGWVLDIDSPFTVWGIASEVGIVRTDQSKAAIIKYAEGAPPKLTPAESLARARQARAEKRAGANQ